MKNILKTITLLFLFQFNLSAQVEEINLDLGTIENLKSRISNEKGQSIVLPFLQNRNIELVLSPHYFIGESIQKRFPNHKNYRVTSPDDPQVSGFLLSSPTGIFYTLNTSQGYVSLRPGETKNKYLIEKGFFHEQHDHYCEVEELFEAEAAVEKSAAEIFSNGEFLRIYRMAIVVTGEFYEKNGDNDDDVLSWVQFSLDGLNAIFQRDMAINFEVGNRLIFYNDSENDAFIPDNDGGESRLTQGSDAIALNFDIDEYDIGHILHSTSSGDDWSGGGIASLGSLCRDNDFGNGISKARGWSGSFNNQTNSWIQLFSHEIGHQCGASHTFNGTGNSCTTNISENNSYEIGSGSTIMSYRGICAADQNQSFSTAVDNYFHVNSLEAMVNQINGNSDCNTVFETNNFLPILEINPCGVDAYKIPINTPFTLRADATEPNAGQTLSYSWEQYDEDGEGTPTQGFLGEQAANETNTPLFRNYAPSSSPERTFPTMENILSGTINAFEVLPLVEREITMRMVVRDNFEGGGSFIVDEISIDVENGPFELVTPSSETTDVFDAGTTMNIDWETNGSDELCEKVSILLSMDGGETYAITIADEVDYSDGSLAYEIPAGLLSSDNNRIKIECEDHSCFSFFIISEPFTINSDCVGNNHFLCDEEDLLATEGSDELNLEMETIIGNKSTSFAFQGTGSEPLAPFVRTGVDGACQAVTFPSGNAVTTRFLTTPFAVEEDGEYTFIRSGIGYYTIYDEALMDPNDPCAGWIASNTSAVSSDPNGVATSSRSVVIAELTKCTNYIMLATNFNVPPSMTISTSLNPVIFPSELEEGTNYAFILVDLTTNFVSEVLTSSDLRNVKPGFYDFYAIQYLEGIDTQSWIGSTLLDMLLNGNCFVTSNNKKEVIILEDLNDPCNSSSLAINLTSTASGCVNADGTASLEVTGGVEPYMIVWSNDMFGTSITDLAPGNYSVTVTDGEECQRFSNFAIMQAPLPAIDFIPQGNNLAATVSQGSGEYTYAWFLGSEMLDENTGAILLEIEGTYTLVVTDIVSGCVNEASYNYMDVCSSFTAEAEIEQITCSGEANGAISLLVMEGEEPYEYLWTLPDGSSDANSSLSNLGIGTYSYQVTDNQECITSGEVEIIEPDVISINIDFNNESQIGLNDGNLELTVEGGTIPYNYLVEGPNGFTSNQTSLTDLEPGEYCVTVADDNECETEECITIATGACPDGEAMLEFTDVSCFGFEDGTATLTNIPGDGPFEILWSNNETGSSLENLAASDYEVVISDDNGCTQSILFTISSPEQLIIELTSMNESSLGASDGTASVTAVGGTGDYTYSWLFPDDSTQDVAMINDLSPGVYCITVMDENTCVAEDCVEIIEGVDLCADFAIALNLTNVTCFGNTDGTAMVEVIGAMEPLNIEWSTGEIENMIVNLEAGDYSVTVMDANDCMTTETFAVSEPDAISISIATSNESTLGTEDGTMSSSVEGGTGPYSYLWSNGDATEDLMDLAPGEYCLIVTDANDCTMEMCAEVLAGDDPCIDFTLNIISNDVLCFGESTGSIQVMTEGGLEPLTYNWSNMSTDSGIQDLAAGDYEVTVTDANNCSIVEVINISESDELVLIINGTDESALDAGDGTATAVVSGGNPDYTYAWFLANDDDVFSQEITVTDLSPGEYCVAVLDANECLIETCIEILAGDDPCVDFAVTLNPIDVACFGEMTGMAIANIEGGMEPFTYEWSDGSEEMNLNNVSSGTYSLVVTDVNNCEATAEIEINESDELSINIVGTDESSLGAADGTASVEVEGGTEPYNYAWSNGLNTTEISDLSPGNYCVTISDANDCVIEACIDVLEGMDLCADFSISLTANDIACFGEMTGTASVVVEGGTEPYVYLWSNNEITPGLMGLMAGDYSVTVTDANMCEQLGSVTISAPSEISIMLTARNESAMGANDGAISSMVSGGTAPYSYEWTDGSTDEDIVDLMPGNYCLIITDDNGCVVESCIDVFAGGDVCADFSISLSANEVACFGDMTGAAFVNIEGGTAPFTYSWSNGQTSETVTNLAAGPYSVTVSDANDCTAEAMIMIFEFNEINLVLTATEESADDASDGSVSAVVDGGVAPYTYLWDTGDNTQSIQGLSSGTYCLTITDTNGCTSGACSDVITSDGPCAGVSLISTLQEVNETCLGSADGTAMIFVTGGEEPYSYNWSDGQNGQMAIGLGAGVYTVTVNDANGCGISATANIAEGSSLSINVSQQIPESAAGANDGSLSVEISGGTMPYNFNWSNGENSATITDLAGGTYSLTVTDAAGCEADASYEVGTSTAGGTARVQFIHAAFEETVEVLSNDEMVMPYLAFTMATPPMEVRAGQNMTYEFRSLNMSPYRSYPNSFANVSFEDGVSYIAVIHGTFDPNDAYPIEITVRPFDFEKQNEQEVLFNLFNASYDAPNLSLENQSDLLLEDAKYGEFASAQSLASTSQTFALELTESTSGDLVNNYSENFSYWRSNSAVFFTVSSYAEVDKTQLWVALSGGGAYQLQGQFRSNGKGAYGGVGKIEAHIFPNPSNFLPNIDVVLEKANELQVQIFHTSGQLMQEKSFGMLSAGKHRLVMGSNRLNAGNYLVRLISENEVIVKQIQIIN